jgi:YwiC-like protein
MPHVPARRMRQDEEMKPAVRRHSLIFPREHGAWGILLVPLVTGASAGLLAGGAAWPLAPLSIAVLSLFWLRTPVESWIGAAPVRARTPSELALVRNACCALAAVAAAALIWLFHDGRNRALVWIGAAAAAAFLAQALLRWRWRNARMASQMIGAAGLTAVAPAAYYAVAGQWNRAAWSLWIANFLFAGNQVHYVQLRIHAARAVSRREKLSAGRAFLAGQIALTVFLALAGSARLLSWWAALAFLPVLFRGFAWFASESEPLAIHTLGKRELMYAIAFGVLLIAGLRLP